jgi:hypothetical protein
MIPAPPRFAPTNRTGLCDGIAPSPLEAACAETREASLANRKEIRFGLRCAIPGAIHFSDEIFSASTRR